MCARLRAGFGRVCGRWGLFAFALGCASFGDLALAQEQGTATDQNVLCGRVLDAFGKPEGRVRVRAQPVEEPAPGIAGMQEPQTALTDAQGRFVFLRLSSRTYRLSVE